MLFSACLIFTFLLLYNFFLFRSVVKDNANLRATEVNKHIVSTTNSFLTQIIKISKGLESNLQRGHLQESELKRLLLDVVLGNEEVYACRVGFEAHAFYPHEFSLLTHRSVELHPVYQVEIIPDNFTRTDNYIRSVSGKESFFTPPYKEEMLDSASVFTYVLPISHVNEEGIPVVKGALCLYISVDYFNDWLKKKVDFDDGFVAVIGPETQLIAYSDQTNDDILTSVIENKTPTGLNFVMQKIKNKVSAKPGVSKDPSDLEHFGLEQLQVKDWSVAVLLSNKTLLKNSDQVYSHLMKIGIVGLILLTFVFYLIIRRITRPLSRLADSTNLVATGNFNLNLPLNEKKDEVGRLTYSMQAMIDRLKDYFEEMREKERLEGELKVARGIQNAIIPRNYPAFPQATSIDVYGKMRSAKEVGGDFFDYVLCRERYLYFVIGDVSGKGVPASLLMAVARTLFRANACIRDTGEIAGRINKELCLGNETNMFITLFIGILDTYSGLLKFTNAGHNYPFLRKTNGEVTEIKQNHGIPLGMLDTLIYRSDELQLGPNDILMLYTDGVNEARQSQTSFFGVTGVEEYLKNLSTKDSAFDITNGLVERVEAYSTEDTDFKDDITVLTIKFGGDENEG